MEEPMARWETSVDIDAPVDRIWQVMADVAKWPEWTASVRTVEDVTPGFGLGGSALVDARGTPKARWTVTRWEPGRGFDWQTRARGATTVGGHWIEPYAGRSRVTLSIDVRTPFGWLVRPFIGPGIMKNMKIEAAGLKRTSEASHQADRTGLTA